MAFGGHIMACGGHMEGMCGQAQLHPREAGWFVALVPVPYLWFECLGSSSSAQALVSVPGALAQVPGALAQVPGAWRALVGGLTRAKRGRIATLPWACCGCLFKSRSSLRPHAKKEGKNYALARELRKDAVRR